MRTFIIALASALLLAYIVTELFTRIWPGNSLALAALMIVALLINGLFQRKAQRKRRPQSARIASLVARSITRRKNKDTRGNRTPANADERSPRNGERTGERNNDRNSAATSS